MSRKPRLTPRKHPRQDRSRFTVDAILTATSRVLVKEGYTGATMSSIAEVAGVSVGSLYQYFPNKASLVAAVHRRLRVEMVDALHDAVDQTRDRPATEVAQAIVHAVSQRFRSDPELSKVLQLEVPVLGAARKVQDVDTEAMGLIAEFLEERGSAAPELQAFLLLRMVDGAVGAAFIERREQVEDGSAYRELAGLIARLLEV